MTLKANKERLWAAGALIAVSAAAVVVTVPADSAVAMPSLARPACLVVQPQMRPGNPGGNGSKYRHEANGVYGWTLRYTHKEGKHIGLIYAGSGNLRDRRDYWKKEWRLKIRRGDKFTWHVLTRDWDTKAFGRRPHGLSAVLVRKGAEQVAINTFVAWGVANGYEKWNDRNPIGKKYRHQEKAIKEAGTTLLKNQLENNHAGGSKPGDGDELNEGDELPDGGMAEIPGYGDGGSKCN